MVAHRVPLPLRQHGLPLVPNETGDGHWRLQRQRIRQPVRRHLVRVGRAGHPNVGSASPPPAFRVGAIRAAAGKGKKRSDVAKKAKGRKGGGGDGLLGSGEGEGDAWGAGEGDDIVAAAVLSGTTVAALPARLDDDGGGSVLLARPAAATVRLSSPRSKAGGVAAAAASHGATAGAVVSSAVAAASVTTLVAEGEAPAAALPTAGDPLPSFATSEKPGDSSRGFSADANGDAGGGSGVRHAPATRQAAAQADVGEENENEEDEWEEEEEEWEDWEELEDEEDETEGVEAAARVEVWEGDLPPMTEEEEAELLAEAEREIAMLEEERRRSGGKGGVMVEGGAVEWDAGNGFSGVDDGADSGPGSGQQTQVEGLDVEVAEMEKQLQLLQQRLAAAKQQQQQLKAEQQVEQVVAQSGAAKVVGREQEQQQQQQRRREEEEELVEEGEDVQGDADEWDDDLDLEEEEEGEVEGEDVENMTIELRHALRREKSYARELERLLDGDGEDEEGGGRKGKKERGLPAIMRCFDRARIFVKAGDGGDGIVAFRREKFVPNGGPSGGNGGRGGNVYVVADRGLNSLLPFRKAVHFRALRGAHGQGSNRHGEAAKDIEIVVPPGTIIRTVPGRGPTLAPLVGEKRREDVEESAWDEEWRDEGDGGMVVEEVREDEEEGAVLLELVRPGQRELLLAGGRGGRGNAAFKSGKNRAPQLAEHGEAGPEMWVQLELKLVADVGIIGAPNAGKSTLLSVISAAKPKVADYPFTTLVPNLGVVPLDGGDYGSRSKQTEDDSSSSDDSSNADGAASDSLPDTLSFSSLVFADVPGLLEGAHTGIGLGHEFLRHTERCSTLVHVVDGSAAQPLHELEAITAELQLFSPDLAAKPRVVAFNKMDLPHARAQWPAFQAAAAAVLERAGAPAAASVLCMSAATGEGVREVVTAAARLVEAARPADTLFYDGWDATASGEGDEDSWSAQRRSKAGASVAAQVQQARRAALTEFEVTVDRHTRTFYVQGEGIQRFLQMTNWEYFEAARRFGHVMEASGVNAALREQGVREGDSVVVGDMEFDWKDKEDWSALDSGWKRGTRGTKVWPH